MYHLISIAIKSNSEIPVFKQLSHLTLINSLIVIINRLNHCCHIFADNSILIKCLTMRITVLFFKVSGLTLHTRYDRYFCAQSSSFPWTQDKLVQLHVDPVPQLSEVIDAVFRYILQINHVHQANFLVAIFGIKMQKQVMPERFLLSKYFSNVS